MANAKAKSHVELDLFGLQQSPRLDRRQSFRGISKMNPEIVKNVIASSMHVAPLSLPSTPTPTPTPTRRLEMSQLPVFHPLHLSDSGPDNSLDLENAAPMTIFYNGFVSVFDLPKDKAAYIMKLAMEKNISISNDGNIVDHSSLSSDTSHNIFGPLNDGDMPIKRKKSLQRFFEKRKERLIWVSPYARMDHVHVVPGLNQPKD